MAELRQEIADKLWGGRGPLIPRAIVNFFSGNQGKTLLVKGLPGAGKTSFAFTLLLTLEANGVYLSTRVNPDILYSQIPWLRERLPAESIIDATQSERQKTAGLKEVPAIRALKYTDVPDFLKGVYQRTEKLEAPLVIIDSWDAIVAQTGFYEPREREKLEYNLCDFAHRTGTRFVFIAEYAELKPLDYLADGVISIESEEFEGKTLRKMRLTKLRGQPIKQPVHLFTLHQGIFKSLSAFAGVHVNSSQPPSPLSDIDEDRLSTGIRDLDGAVGGYGHLSLFKGDSTVYDLLLLPFIVNALSLGKRLRFANSMHSAMKKVLPFIPEGQPKETLMLPVKGVKEWEGQAAELAAANSIWFLSSDDVNGGSREVISAITERGGFVLAFVSREGDAMGEMEAVASPSLVLKMLCGVPCLWGGKPTTEMMALEVETSRGFPEVVLTPII